jgi:hypothetical protein
VVNGWVVEYTLYGFHSIAYCCRVVRVSILYHLVGHDCSYRFALVCNAIRLISVYISIWDSVCKCSVLSQVSTIGVGEYGV